MTKLFIEFLKTEKAAGVILIFCTLLSISLANSPLSNSYSSVWQTVLGGHSLTFWINDVLMTLFFLLIGLEIEREIYVGELSKPRNALLPTIAALGGMIGPAAFHLSLNAGTMTQAGFGIPMATDIAFSLGVLSLLGSRVPLGLKVFLTALAIVDDVGAIIIIAFFYTTALSVFNLLVAIGIILALFVLNRLRIQNLWLYLVLGVALWYFIHESGIHSTIAGVILAFLIPFGKGDDFSPSFKLQHRLHYLVAFLVLPLFALANTALEIRPESFASLLLPNGIGIIGGLIVGNIVGINLFAFLGVRANLCSLPSDTSWKHIFGVSLLAGIGFTMSIFVSTLAFQDTELVQQSKMAILVASLVAGIAGYFSLRLLLNRQSNPLSGS
jgi:NhaA family Na+:H+ antiporter